MANYSKEELQYIASQVQPYLLELVKSNGLDVDSIEVVEDTDGITSLPAYDNRGGTKKVVRVPLSTFSKPAQDAADSLADSIAAASEAAENANTAADNANTAAEDISSYKTEIEQAVADAQKAAEDAQAALTDVTDKVDEINSSESSRQEAEQARQEAESSRATEYTSLKEEMESSIEEMDAATGSALDTAHHPTYIGNDNYVYIWDKENQVYEKTTIYVKGDTGEGGLEPIINFGEVTTLEPSEEAMAVWTDLGFNDEGRPIYQLDLSIPRGLKGENGSGSGNVLVSTSGLSSGKTYLFQPNQNESAEGSFVEYEIPEIDTSTLVTSDGLAEALGSYAKTEDVPTKVSELENDSDYATPIYSGNYNGEQIKLPFSDIIGVESDLTLNTSGSDTYITYPSEIDINYNKYGGIKRIDVYTMSSYYTKINEATHDKAGFMTAEDKTKLDGIDMDSKQDKSLYFTDLSASEWVEDTTFTDYPYRCDLSCEGVTADMYAAVVFGLVQASAGNYAPVCETGTDIVSIWSKESETITVPTIIITK